MAKISGPLLDRIDIHIEVPAVPFRELSGGHAGHVAAPQMREQVVDGPRDPAGSASPARARGSNGQMTHRQIRDLCPLDDGRA